MPQLVLSTKNNRQRPTAAMSTVTGDPSHNSAVRASVAELPDEEDQVLVDVLAVKRVSHNALLAPCDRRRTAPPRQGTTTPSTSPIPPPWPAAARHCRSPKAQGGGHGEEFLIVLHY